VLIGRIGRTDWQDWQDKSMAADTEDSSMIVNAADAADDSVQLLAAADTLLYQPSIVPQHCAYASI
jgi:hypothetical protein